jgi:hypothetical protein
LASTCRTPGMPGVASSDLAATAGLEDRRRLLKRSKMPTPALGRRVPPDIPPVDVFRVRCRDSVVESEVQVCVLGLGVKVQAFGFGVEG